MKFINNGKGMDPDTIKSLRDIAEPSKSETLLQRLVAEQQAIFDSIPAWIFYKDKENRFVRVNNVVAEMMGRRKEELEGGSIFDFYPKEQADAFWKDDKEVIASGKPKLGIVEPVDTAKGKRWVRTDKIPYLDRNGNILGIIGFAVDVTDRLEAEQRLKESEMKFRLLFDESRDGVLVADIDTKLFFMCNKAICNMLGYTEEEIKRLGVKDIHPEKDLPAIIEIFESQVRGEKNLIESLPVKKKDGSIFYADIAASTIALDHKKYLMGSFRDTTERRAAQETLKISEESYRSIFESVNDAIVIRDIKTYEIADVNNKACEIFCYSKNEMIGMSLGALSVNTAQYPVEKIKQLYDKAAQGEPQIFEWLVKDKYSREFWVEINVKKAIIGGQYRLIYIARDITERRQLFEQKENFMNMVSHELRTPLGAIKESVSLLQETKIGPIDEKQKELIEIAKRNLDRLARLIDHVLDLQKIDVGRMKLDLNKHDMNKIIEEVQRAMISLAAKKGLKLALKLDDKLPHVKFDRDKVIQVLTNLVNNAIKFTEKGAITIISSRGNNFIKVSVRDTGPGIASNDILKLFQRFLQLNRAPGGTGLGLAISKEIIELHRGKIGAESEIGKGAIFHFILPVEERRK